VVAVSLKKKKVLIRRGWIYRERTAAAGTAGARSDS